MKINEKQLRNIISKSVRNVLKEGTTNEEIISKWNELLDSVGAETMLECIFEWCSSNQLQTFIDWFEEEGYFGY